MGLFNLLKNGITIEKKRKQEQASGITEVQPEPMPAPAEPAPFTETTALTPDAETLKAEANAIIYGTSVPQPPAAAAPLPPVQPETPPVQQTFNSYSSLPSGFGNALSGQASANQNLLVTAPKSASEISSILSNLASGNACIVSLSQIEDAQRHLDYICGFMNAIGGTILQRTPVEYVLTPKGVGIKS